MRISTTLSWVSKSQQVLNRHVLRAIFTNPLSHGWEINSRGSAEVTGKPTTIHLEQHNQKRLFLTCGTNGKYKWFQLSKRQSFFMYLQSITSLWTDCSFTPDVPTLLCCWYLVGFALKAFRSICNVTAFYVGYIGFLKQTKTNPSQSSH